MWDETKEKLYEREVEFVETESRFINGGLSHTKEVAQAMAQDHRYLVQEIVPLLLGSRMQLCNFDALFFVVV